MAVHNDSSLVIENYEQLSALTEQMREAAENGNWDQLVSLEQQRSELVTRMKPVDAEVKLDEAAHQQKNQLIHKILADDTEIRGLTHDWMGQLQGIMKSICQEQRLLQTYGR